MINIWIVLALLATHFVADFVCQTHEQATNKSKSNYWLSMHVATYTLVLAACTFAILAIFVPNEMETSGLQALIYAVFNGGLHWLTDYVTSRINARLWSEGRTHDFFVGVGADQLIHYTCLLVTFHFLFP
jgi:uncharacterized membrane-anchored protein